MRLLIASDAHGDANATHLLRESYAIERPDLVVHLGDMIDGQTANASTSLRALLAAGAARGRRAHAGARALARVSRPDVTCDSVTS